MRRGNHERWRTCITAPRSRPTRGKTQYQTGFRINRTKLLPPVPSGLPPRWDIGRYAQVKLSFSFPTSFLAMGLGPQVCGFRAYSKVPQHFPCLRRQIPRLASPQFRAGRETRSNQGAIGCCLPRAPRQPGPPPLRRQIGWQHQRRFSRGRYQV